MKRAFTPPLSSCRTGHAPGGAVRLRLWLLTGHDRPVFRQEPDVQAYLPIGMVNDRQQDLDQINQRGYAIYDLCLILDTRPHFGHSPTRAGQAWHTP